MPGIIPEASSGAIPARNEAGACLDPVGVSNYYCPSATFTSTCAFSFLPDDCTARITAAQINAITSEMLALGEAMDPDGEWDCDNVNNLASLFTQWRNSEVFISRVEGEGVTSVFDPLTGSTTYTVAMTDVETADAAGTDDFGQSYYEGANLLKLRDGDEFALLGESNEFEVRDVPTLMANTDGFTYATGQRRTVMPGDIIRTRAEGIAFEVLPIPANSDLPVTGGLSLDALLGEEGTLDARAFGTKGDGVTDDLAAINRALAALKELNGGKLVFPTATYAASDTIEITGFNTTDKLGYVGTEISGIGAKIVSSAAINSLRLDNLKDVDIVGFVLEGTNQIEVNGMWRCTMHRVRGGKLVFGDADGSVNNFDSHFWNSFNDCSFSEVSFVTESGGDDNEFSSAKFDSCVIQKGEYAISVYGSKGPQSVSFVQCDFSYYTGGAWIHVDEPVAANSSINFFGGYWDSSGEITDTKGLILNFFGTHAPLGAQNRANVTKDGSRQFILSGSGSGRNGGRLPSSGVNLIKNGTLKRGLADIVRGSFSTLSIEPGHGMYDQHLNVLCDPSENVQFNSEKVPFSGLYSLTVIGRVNGGTLDNTSLKVNNVLVVASAVVLNSEWSVCTAEVPCEAGDVVTVTLGTGAGSSCNFDLGYVGLTFGKQGLLTAEEPSPHYDEGGFTPILADGTGVTYGTRSASFVKVGKQVTVTFDIEATSIGADTSPVAVGGLPYTPAGNGACLLTLDTESSDIVDWATTEFGGARQLSGTNKLALYTPTGTPISYNDAEANGRLVGMGTYFTD